MPLCFLPLHSSPRAGSEPNSGPRWNLDSEHLGMGVHAGMTLLTAATNPNHLSKMSPPSLWVTLSTSLFCIIFLHSTYHHLELHTCFLGYCLSPSGEYKCREDRNTVPNPKQYMLTEWMTPFNVSFGHIPLTIRPALVPPLRVLMILLHLEGLHLSPQPTYTYFF